MLAMTRDLLLVRENYNVYYRGTALTYKAKSPIGEPPHLDAFDCDEPEDTVTQSIPESCAVETEEQEDVEKEFEAKQDYTILQKVPTFEYAATLCTLRKSRHY